MNQRYTYLLIVLLTVNFSYGQVFWSEDFSDTSFPEDWTTEDANQEEDSNVIWELCQEDNCISSVGFPLFQSETASNGYMILNSDAAGYDYLGQHISQLNTPAINCSGKEQVYLEFQSFIGAAINNPANRAIIKVWTSEEDTITLKPYPQLFMDNSNEISDNPEVLNFDISAIAANQSEVFIQWEWTSKYEFFWCIDDVRLSESDFTQLPRTIWHERFDDGPEGWEISFDSTGAEWIWDPFGDISNSALYLNEDPIQSATGHDGVMIFPADYYTFMGVPGPSPYPFYDAEIISPIIDLSSVEFPVDLVFTQLVSRLNAAPNAPFNSNNERIVTSFEYSLDGGETWSTPIDANEGLAQQQLLYSTERFSLDSLEGQANIRLKFRFSGDLFFWAIDDISIIERAPYDLKVMRNFFAVMPNAITPISQVAEERFVADIRNEGLLEATGTNLRLNIVNEENGQEVYNSINEFGTVEPGTLVENMLFEEALDPTMITQAGIYNGIYTVSIDSVDLVPSNDTIDWNFEISDTVFAKERGYINGRAPESENSYTYGNFFFVPNGDGYEATSISFGVFNTQALENRSVKTYLYRWLGDANNDDFIQENELEGPLGFNSYVFDGTERRNLITVSIDVDTAAIPLIDSSYYLALVEYSTTDTQKLFFNASQDYDYGAVTFVGEVNNCPRYASVVDIGNTGSFNPAGFGPNIIPQVRLNIQPIVDNVQENIFEHASIEILPNPSDGIFSLKIDLRENIEYIQILIRDSSGKIVKSKKLSNFQQKQLTFDARNWPSGLYFLELQNETNLYHKKIIIQK